MNAQTIIPSNSVSFKMFVLNNRRNRITLWMALAAIIIQFAIFKYYYPFASYIHGDSFNYLKAAHENLSINTYLIGYSKFLRLFSVFSNTDYMLVAFQFLLIHLGLFFLLLTIFYFIKIGKVIQTILLCFTVFNPLFLHLANLVSSDALFLALSSFWFSLLLWIIYRPSNKIIVWHGITLFLAFTVRHNTLIYPFISVAAFLISNLSLRKKVAGISLAFILCGWFVAFTMFQYKNLTGYWQYSPFSGWQLVNNAMYTYKYVDSGDRKPVPVKYKVLDKMIREYFDSTRDLQKFPYERWMASTVYMWTPTLTLYKYRNQLFLNDTTIKEFKKWASMGPFYKEYGIYIIKKYPWHFLRYFAWPNANKYYAPPVEFLEYYNGNSTKVEKVAKMWFGYKNVPIKSRFKDNRVWVLDFYPILSGIINVTMVCFLVFYLVLNGWKYRKDFNQGLFISVTFWISNAFFTIFASAAALRFQSFPIIVTFIFVVLLVDWMFHLMKSMQEKPSNKINHNENTGRELAEKPLLQ